MKERIIKNCTTIYSAGSHRAVIWMLHKNRRVSIFLDDIIYLESQANYTIFYLNNGKTIINSRTMGIFENVLGSESFFRIHRSFIVNLNYINEVQIIKNTSGEVVLSTGKKIILSRRKIKPFLQEFTNYEVTNSEISIHINNHSVAA